MYRGENNRTRSPLLGSPSNSDPIKCRKTNPLPQKTRIKYKLSRFLQPHRVGFLRRFGLKTGIRFAHFGQGSGMVFEGATEWI